MDFSGMTVEVLLDRLVETGECRTWEFKSVASLKDNFHSKLARQVSAFANSLGGHIVIGVKEVVKGVKYEPEVVPSVQGKTPTQDWLARMVSTSVSYPLQEFQIHRIPFKNNAEEAIFVIEVGDSPTAPHQTNVNDEKVYYWRYQSRTEHAPHIHLELLRSRYTKTVLTVEDIHLYLNDWQNCGENAEMDVFFSLEAKVRNTSFHVATHWGVQFKQPDDVFAWRAQNHESELCDGVFVRGTKDVLLPTEFDHVQLMIFCRIKLHGHSIDSAILSMAREISLSARPISQNHVGQEFSFVPMSPDREDDTVQHVSDRVLTMLQSPSGR